MRCLSFIVLCKLSVILAESDCGCSESRASIGETREEEGSQNGNAWSPHLASEEVCPAGSHDKMIFVEGGDFMMGSNKPIIMMDGEHPARLKKVPSFWLDAVEISNEAFEKFVNETGYLTEAERIGDSFVLASSVTDVSAIQGYAEVAPWWCNVRGASWRRPEGPGSNISKRGRYPVVHVSWGDAKNYCEFYRKRLPTEAEWEMACSKALDGKPFPWNEQLVDAEHQKSANIWQGEFPLENTKIDGFEGTAPVDSYETYPGLPVKNMIGNVWEWTADIWTTDHRQAPDENVPNRVKKGGSFMCHASYCYRYRCQARSENTLDTSASNCHLFSELCYWNSIIKEKSDRKLEFFRTMPKISVLSPEFKVFPILINKISSIQKTILGNNFLNNTGLDMLHPLDQTVECCCGTPQLRNSCCCGVKITYLCKGSFQ